jgi:hypothetical protein
VPRVRRVPTGDQRASRTPVLLWISTSVSREERGKY